MKWKFLVLVTAIILATVNPLITFAQSTQSYTVENGSISGVNTGRYNNRPLYINNIKPTAEFTKAPLKPQVMPDCNQSILLGHSAFQVSDTDIQLGLRYEPLEDGGFKFSGDPKDPKKGKFNRQITHERNSLLTGDLPIFTVQTSMGRGVYPHAKDRCFPIFNRKDAKNAQYPATLGTMMLGVLKKTGAALWFNELQNTRVTFRPGYTVYEITAPDNEWKAKLTIAPALDFHGFVAKVEFDKPMPLNIRYSDIFWEPKDTNNNTLTIATNIAAFTEANLPNGKILIGWDSKGDAQSKKMKNGDILDVKGTEARKVHYIVQAWGVTDYDKAVADEMMNRLDTENSKAWPEHVKRMKKEWFDCYIGRALNPEKNLETLLKDPANELHKTMKYWDDRRNSFQIKTPDPYVNAIVNFERAVSEYHKMGPGLVLSSKEWIMYSHISVGWYGKLWAGDHNGVADHMRFLGTMQDKDGYMPWISPSLTAYTAEKNTPYWVDHIYWYYAWTGDKQYITELWPLIKKAVAYEQKANDPDGDGLFQSWYEYWNADSNGKGPKAAMPTSTAWAMYDRAAKMAEAVNDKTAATEYRNKADNTKRQALKELWNDKVGILGSIGVEGIWRGQPQIWEQYTGVVNGLLPLDKGRRAMRWLEEHYGFEPTKDIKLLMCDAWWPLRWSVHWVPVGDMLLACEAGMKTGDADLWWPYFRTVAMSSFRSDQPGVRLAISNSGAGSGGVEFIDSDDPHMQATVRGLFGITPEVNNGIIHISPAFPSDWTSASIKSPAISYSYERTGNKVVMTITTPQPLVKVVRARFDVPASTTQKETVSTVELTIPAGNPTPEIVRNHRPILTDITPPVKEARLDAGEKQRLELMDLSEIYNTTLSTLVKETKFVPDYGLPTTNKDWWMTIATKILQTPSAYGLPTTIKDWWMTVPGKLNDGPEIITADNGVDFLLKGRSESVKGKANSLIALSSWGTPYPLPAAITIPVNKKVKKIWLLMSNYVSPIKNYIPNGEIVLHYTTGEKRIISLVPPYNMDCYFQAFSREGTAVDINELEWTGGWSPCRPHLCKAQANALPVECDPARILKAIEVRATVSEGVIGINAITLLPAK